MSGWTISTSKLVAPHWRAAASAFALFFLLAAVLQAQTPRPDPWGNPEIGYESGFKRAEMVIAQCLERVGSIAEADPATCAHTAFLTCEHEHGTMSQRDLNDCAAFSRKAWEKRLDAALSQLLGTQTIDPKFGLAEPEVERLRQSNQRWREWNEADCELQAGDAEGGGTMRSMLRDLCFSDHAAHRALELEALIFWWEKSFKL